MALSKNQCILLTITDTSSLGSGIGRYTEPGEEGGIVVFVPLTAVGDVIECKILKVEKRCAYGKIERIVKPSPDRILGEPDCPVFGKCGGCAWRHVTYEAELRYKRKHVEDALKRIGKSDVAIASPVGSEQQERYRNKAQFPVANGEHRPLFGFYAPHSHRLVEQRDCLLQPEHFADALKAIGRWMKKNDVKAYDESTGQGLLRHVYLRNAEVTGQTMVCLVCTSGKLPSATQLVDELRREVPSMVSLMININREKTNVILGETAFPLWGQDHIVDELCGLRFRLSVHSFYQVNRRQAERLYELAAEAAGFSGEETLLDLYCGTGTIGLSMAHRVKQLIGVEIVPQAVEDAEKNALENGIQNARFICSDAGKAALKLEKEGVKPDVIVVDPPRKGCDTTVIETIGRMQPSRLVYVSCDPATLSRDTARLAEVGYSPECVTPVDLFSRTAHIENVARFVRLEKTV